MNNLNNECNDIELCKKIKRKRNSYNSDCWIYDSNLYPDILDFFANFPIIYVEMENNFLFE